MEKPKHESFMQRCFDLAKLGGVEAAPNPMVGAVLVHDGDIIGEGYHQKYGEAHAEVNCVNDALKRHADKISSSTLYVSLEPCSHFGKTPPCTNLIIQYKIPRVVIGCIDSFEQVKGKGVAQLKNAGISLITDVLKEEAISLNKRFFTFYKEKRPYIILKWAQTNDGFIASEKDKRLFITNEFTNRLVHKWRSQETAIMIGTDTALKDDPVLNNRHWFGRPPLKIVIDSTLRLPTSLKIFNTGNTLVVNTLKQEKAGNIEYVKVEKENMLGNLLTHCYTSGIQSILVEGGRKLLQSFIDEDLWDEARVITNKDMSISAGLLAPSLSKHIKLREEMIANDCIEYFKHTNNFFINNGR